ncbi:hypothetical protein AVEN_48332-1 [Araneus ventricosus]|uniref:Uncharacterized protein n=1 Tax=Araneus ventricosus TaxID=182803 RepID=A0A4Y2UA81_ARAVE|nr:hypothetical protein AVEN_97469-1 [Araneus ventricosus]GBO08480.1 hypothetical protein AVEN_48332-1 [Araneus ventricosus]
MATVTESAPDTSGRHKVTDMVATVLDTEDMDMVVLADMEVTVLETGVLDMAALGDMEVLDMDMMLTCKCLKATGLLFWDGPCNFDLLSDDEDDAWAGTTSPTFRTIPTGFEPRTSVPGAKTLPLGYVCLQFDIGDILNCNFVNSNKSRHLKF